MSYIEFKGISKFYGENEVLQKIRFKYKKR